MNAKAILENILYIGESLIGLHLWDFIPYQSIYKKSYSKLVQQSEKMNTSIDKAKHIFENSCASKNRKYAFFAFCAGHPKEIRLLIAISKFLQKNSHKTIWSLCKSTPFTCESFEFKKKNLLKCWACTREMVQVLSIFHEEYFIFKKHSKRIQLDDNMDKIKFHDLLHYVYKSINVGEIAKYSLFKRYKNDQVDEGWEKDLRRNIKSFILTFEATKKAIREEKITDVIIMGGQYLNYRAVLLAARDSNINYFTYENFGVNRLLIAKNDECFNFPIKMNEARLTKSQKNQAIKLFEDLRTGKYYHKMFNYESKNELLDKIRHFKNFISVFPNVSWDSATFYKDAGIFKDQYEWLRETIRFCIDTKRNLVIRIHPGEIQMNEKFKLVNFINEWFPKLPSNVVVFDSRDKISSYDIISQTNVSCVYVSTLGMEIPYYRVPTIVVGKAYYMNYGFTINPRKSDEYFSVLAKYHDRKQRLTDIDALLNYILSLQEYRRKIHYGDFLKFTGRQEFGPDRGHSFDFDKSIYSGFPWEKEDFSNIVKIFSE